jgi:hypothetical protein
MLLEAIIARRGEAAREFDEHQGRSDGTHVATSLAHGLSMLRDLMFMRLHDDVERNFGQDSMLMPLSLKDTEARSKFEIELFLIAAAAVEARDHGYVSDASWCAQWLARLRLGDAAGTEQAVKRLTKYLEYDAEKRRLAFSSALVKVLPESTKAPLVLYRLFPHAVSIVTATAFRDSLAAAEARNRQVALLPGIGECHECHGRPLDNGERCHVCGNPVWNYAWLTETE